MRTFAGIVTVLILAGWATQATAGDKGTTVDLDGLKSTAPATWKAPSAGTKLGTFRKYQFALPKADGDKEDAELVIFHFGAGGGGSNSDNIKRWKAMFAAPAGKEIDDVTKVSEFKVGSVPVTYVEISGTYLYKFPPAAPNAKVTPKDNFRFIGVIFDNNGGPNFIRVTGPARTVEAHKKGFDEWLKALK
jgi:hypothetical protein